jgi:hypothetical protein
MQLSCTAQPIANELITCLCMYCAGACVDENTCIQDWQNNVGTTSDCQSCTSALQQSTCLGQVEACQMN